MRKQSLKKTASILMSLVLFVGMTTLSALSQQGTAIPNYGDVNNDGKIDAADVTMLRSYIAAQDKAAWLDVNPGFNPANADVNGDGWINAADVTLLRRWIAAVDKSTVKLGPRMSDRAIVTFIAEQNAIHTITVSAEDMDSFANITYALSYDTSKLRLLDFAAHMPGFNLHPGIVPDTDLEIISHNPSTGWLTFRVNKNIQLGEVWAGNITVLRFRGMAGGMTTISILQQ